MSNWLTNEINKYLDPNNTILDLCCGIGDVTDGLKCSSITGIDVYEPYLITYQQKIKNSQTLLLNLNELTYKEQNIFQPKSYDVVLCIDGVEHLHFDKAVSLIENMEKIAKKKVIIFTPENVSDPNQITLNHVKDAWGISGNNYWQEHKCALPRTFFNQKNYKIIQLNTARNVYDNSLYYEMLYVKEI